MRRCRGGKAHHPEPQRDPSVMSECALTEVWTPDGVKEAWLCAHHLVCKVCKRVVSEVVTCPLNKDKVPQDRRWR